MRGCKQSGALLVAAMLAMAACKGATGPAGANGADGANGSNGSNGSNGADGTNGTNGTNGVSAVSTGLNITVDSVTANSDGTNVAVRFTLKDDRGYAVDPNGVYSLNAPFKISFSLSYIPAADASGNVPAFKVLTRSGSSSTTTTPTTQPTAFSPLFGSFGTPNPQMSGTLVENGYGNGDFTYTFPTGGTTSVTANGKTTTTVVDPTQYDLTKLSNTHVVWIQASRQTDLANAADPLTFKAVNAEYDFVPAGGTPARRELVTTAACSRCHDRFASEDPTTAFHGGGRVQSPYCNVCHNPDRVSNPDANSKVFVHRIHYSAKLVFQGAINGLPTGTKNDIFHGIANVTYPQDVRNCTTCHDPAAAQPNQWQTNPTIQACTSCHDYVDFTGGATSNCTPGSPPAPGSATTCNHAGGPGFTDSNCAGCHGQGQTLSVATVHALTTVSPNTITVDNATVDASGVPTVTFTVSGSRDVVASPFETLGVTWAGPTTEYANFANFKIAQSGCTAAPTCAAGAACCTALGNGQYQFQFPSTGADGYGNAYTIPAGALTAPTSSPVTYAFMVEADDTGSKAVLGIQPKLVNVNGSTATPVARRNVVDLASCNKCHQQLGAHHSGNRTDPQYCVFCHNPSRTQNNYVNRAQLDPTTLSATRVGLPIEFSVFIHRIHTGDKNQNMGAGSYYAYGGAPLYGAPLDTEVTFPGNRMNCDECHTAGKKTWKLPLDSNVAPSVTEWTYVCGDSGTLSTTVACTTWQPKVSSYSIPNTTAICMGCHNSTAVAAHAAENTTTLFDPVKGANTVVEACVTCHGAGQFMDVAVVH